MRALQHKALRWALSLVLGSVFVYASLDKIAHPPEFARIVYHYRLIGPSRILGPMPANLLAVTLPFVEVAIGLCLLTGLWREEAAAIAAVLLLVFVASVGLALARGIDIENCGCFTVTGAGRAGGLKLILEDLALLVAAAVLALARRSDPAPQGKGAPSP